MRGRDLCEYHVFLASPGDVTAERSAVRAYFDDLNRTAGAARGIRLQVVDWENYASAGVGRPQELITGQTLERFRSSLVLVIVIMAQRFGTPSGMAESGTEEEVRWALESNRECGFPEIKFFFRDFEQFVGPTDPSQLVEAVEQWQRVRAFRQGIESSRAALCQAYPNPSEFGAVLHRDLDLWFHDEARPWSASPAVAAPVAGDLLLPPAGYFQDLARKYRWLDIAGIDSDRAFKLPLEEIYVRLRVISTADDSGETAEDATPLDIQEALQRYRRLVIVGDPGSGKSTFLKFIALTLAECVIAGDVGAAVRRLSLDTPLPIPILISCWDLSEQLQKRERANLEAVVDFVIDRLAEAGWPIDRPGLERLLNEHEFIVLVDGLDEVPTDAGRHLISGLIDELVDAYPQSRYVVTSRVRAYTGGTVLGQQFARCDIQPFSREERAAFLRNWVNQLFSVREPGASGSADAAAELAALTDAIETSSIRPLAVNPLLLTVIAIVHWNRKRLPEQRVDLYDECIDVLLGQRKQAEQQRISRDTKVLDEAYSEDRLDQRIKVRKRFAELAYAILSRSGEEIDQAAAVAILEPHFRNGSTDGSARAARFLDRQELRSGLLVRRRTSSYRFVHLTFLEYLAAWFLANRDLDRTLEDIKPNLRQSTWFETLQLLGSELANRSDEYLDRYVSWLLDNAGTTIREQAPVVALAANIVRDTDAVATIGTETRERYDRLLRETFAAFSPDSKVPKRTQLDLLEALGTLGASVKLQLISATSSRLLDVRRRALEMLIPHLSDDDLFSMTHVLADRSKEPIKTYINALVARDRVRAGRTILQLDHWGDKTFEALIEADKPTLPPDSIDAWPHLVGAFARYLFIWHARLNDPMQDVLTWLVQADSSRLLNFLESWDDRRPATRDLVRTLAEAGSSEATGVLARLWPDREDTWDVLGRLAERGSQAAAELVVVRRDAQSSGLIRRLAEHGSAGAIFALAHRLGTDPDTWELLTRLAERGVEPAIRMLTLQHADKKETWQLLTRLAGGGSASAIRALASSYSDRDQTWELLGRLADDGVTEAVQAVTAYTHDRQAQELALTLLERGLLFSIEWAGPGEVSVYIRTSCDLCSVPLWDTYTQGERDREDLLKLINHLASMGSEQAVAVLAEEWLAKKDERWKSVVMQRAEEGSPLAIGSLLKWRRGDAATWELITRITEQGSDRAIGALAQHQHDPGIWDLIVRLAERGMPTAIQVFAHRHSDRAGAPELIRRLAVRGSTPAVEALLNFWRYDDDTWDLIRGLAGRNDLATQVVAWLDWAIATVGPERAKEHFAFALPKTQ